MLCVHSIFQSEETRWPIAQAMARAGFVAINVNLTPDQAFNDYTHFIDTAADSSLEPVYLWGQSMGADLVAACQSKKIRAMVTVGFPSAQLQEGELNLVGAWDELHSLNEFQPSAKILFFSNHGGENFDLQGFRLAARRFGGQEISWLDPFWGRALLAFGILMVSATCQLWASRVGPLILGASALLSWQLDPCHAVARALVVGLALQNGRKVFLPAKVWWAMAAAVASGMLVNSGPTWLQEPRLLATLAPAMLCQAATAWLTLASNFNGWTCLGLVAAEMAWPGKLLAALLYLPGKLWDGAPKLAFRVGKVSLRQALLLVGVLGLAVSEWAKVGAVGYAPDATQLLSLIRHLVALILVPLTVFVALARRASQQQGSTPGPDLPTSSAYVQDLPL